MTKSELIERFINESINPMAYSFDKGKWGDEYVLSNPSLGVWEVSYFERGHYNLLKRSNLQSEACEYFYQVVKKYSDMFT